MAKKKQASVKQQNDPVAFVLCYTLRRNFDGKETDTDHWEVFAEYGEDESTPEQQAKMRLGAITAQYENDPETELYTWNIAAIANTNEWYKTGTCTQWLDFIPAAVPDQWDAIEMDGVAYLPEQDCCERVFEEGQATFYSVYLHDVNGGVQCVADLPDQKSAQNLYDLIEKAVKNKADDRFPNGLQKWKETYFEVVAYLSATRNEPNSMASNVGYTGGTTALYDLAEELTDKFERLHKGREWDGEFWDEIEAWLKSEDEKHANSIG